jgi:predicted phage-related endonuclease
MRVYPINSRADWLAMRKMDVTASEVPALFGVSKWSSPLQVFADKTGGGRDFGDNMAMKAGRIMESAVAAAVQEMHPEWEIEKATKYYRNEERRIGCTPDYFRIVKRDDTNWPDKLPIECKFVQPAIYAKDWQEGPPLMYVLQTLVQVHVTGAYAGYIAAMLDNRAKDVFLFDVPRNDAAWKKICDRVHQFWQDVAAGNLPGADYTQDGAALKEMYPADEKAKPLDLRGDNRLSEVLAKRENITAAIKVMKDELEHLDAEVIDKLKGAPAATCNGYSLTYKQQTRKEHTVKASTFSVLRVTKTKEETEL